MGHAECSKAGQQQRPEQVRVALDELAGVVHEAVPRHQVLCVAKRDEAVVAQPRAPRRGDDSADEEAGHREQLDSHPGKRLTGPPRSQRAQRLHRIHAFTADPSSGSRSPVLAACSGVLLPVGNQQFHGDSRYDFQIFIEKLVEEPIAGMVAEEGQAALGTSALEMR